jgi:hypothetical protein
VRDINRTGVLKRSRIPSQKLGIALATVDTSPIVNSQDLPKHLRYFYVVSAKKITKHTSRHENIVYVKLNLFQVMCVFITKSFSVSKN